MNKKTMAMIQGFIQKSWRILLVIPKSGYKEFPTNIKVFIFFVLLKMLKFMFFQRFLPLCLGYPENKKGRPQSCSTLRFEYRHLKIKISNKS